MKRAKSLSQALERNLSAYAMASSAAGVAMLALAPPAQAEIVYTPTHVTIQGNYFLDLANNGTDGFALWHSNSCIGTTWCATFLLIYPNFNSDNGFLATAQGRLKSAVALPRGAKIGRHGLFNDNIGLMAEHIKKAIGHRTYAYYWKGQWANGGKGLKDGYLGLKFKIKGDFHFGWARVTVKSNGFWPLTAILTGYAYETVPGKAIIAGKTKGPDEKRVGSLGALAAGAVGR